MWLNYISLLLYLRHNFMAIGYGAIGKGDIRINATECFCTLRLVRFVLKLSSCDGSLRLWFWSREQPIIRVHSARYWVKNIHFINPYIISSYNYWTDSYYVYGNGEKYFYPRPISNLLNLFLIQVFSTWFPHAWY